MSPMYFYIEALYKYLLDNISGIADILYKEAIPQNDLQRFVLIADLGGEYEDSQQREYQPELLIVTQDTSAYAAKMLAYEVFEAVRQIHDLTLPVSYEWHEETKTAEINFAKLMAGSTPSPQGNTGNGLFQYVTVLKLSVCDDEDPE